MKAQYFAHLWIIAAPSRNCNERTTIGVRCGRDAISMIGRHVLFVIMVPRPAMRFIKLRPVGLHCAMPRLHTIVIVRHRDGVFIKQPRGLASEGKKPLS